MSTGDTGKKTLEAKLLNWFRQFARDLPWRRTRDPYRIWISEIMLQQTRVAAVIPYYERFLARFPDIPSLAEAPEQEVLRLWAGLGYYGRARNLRHAAKKIVAEHAGGFPRKVEEAMDLPGIGRYTAAAVLSIAYGEKAAVLDGNVARVLARFSAMRGDIREPKRWAALQAMADGLLAGRAPGEWNQALMELGATLCTPRSPQCLLCPLTRSCEARKQGIAAQLPEKRNRRATVAVKLATAVFVDPSGRTLLLPPPEGPWGVRRADHVPALVSRMWHFPTVSVRGGSADDLKAYLGQSFGPSNPQEERWIRLGSVRHAVTFRDIRLEVFLILVRALPVSEGARVLPISGLSSLPVSNLTQKAARLARASWPSQNPGRNTRDRQNRPANTLPRGYQRSPLEARLPPGVDESSS